LILTGFRTGSYCTCWEIKPRSNTMTSVRISINRKDKNTGGYVQDFGGYVSFIGTACADKAAKLKPKDRIKLGDVDVNNRYDAEKKVTYTNFNVYSFEMADSAQQAPASYAEPEPDDDPSGDLPF